MSIEVGLTEPQPLEVTFEEINAGVEVSVDSTPVVIEFPTPPEIQVAVNEVYQTNGGGGSGKSPYIGGNGNWFYYDDNLHQFVDSGIKARGDNGVTFIPTVDINGNISWSNNGGLPNPLPINIKGPTGKTAYESAVTGGYTGTESQFNTDLSTVSTKVTSTSGLDTSDKIIDRANKETVRHTIVCLGDSITEGNTSAGQYSYCNFEPMLSHSVNCGIGGTTLSTHQNSHYAPFSITELVKAITTNVWTTQDIEAEWLFVNTGDDNRPIIARLKAIDWTTITDLSIFSGTNDFGITIPNSIGDVTSTSNYTIYGAMSYIISTFNTTYPNIKINFFTPIYRSRIISGDGKDSDKNANLLGFRLVDYVTAIKNSCSINKINCVDTYYTSGINKFTSTTLLTDGLHPNQLGAIILSNIVYNGLNSTNIENYDYVPKYVLGNITIPTDTTSITIDTTRDGILFSEINLKSITIAVDASLVPTGSGVIFLRVNGVNSGYNTVGFVSNVDSFAVTADTVFKSYITIDVSSLGTIYTTNSFRAASLNPIVNGAHQSISGVNTSINTKINSISLLLGSKTLKAGSNIKIYRND